MVDIFFGVYETVCQQYVTYWITLKFQMDFREALYIKYLFLDNLVTSFFGVEK